MPSRRLPNTTPAVIRTLTTARDAWKQYPAGSRAYYDRDVSATTLPELDSIPAGEARRAAAAGSTYTAMALPSTAEVAAVEGPCAATASSPWPTPTSSKMSSLPSTPRPNGWP